MAGVGRFQHLVPIGFVAKQESVFVGSADAPWKDLKEITEAALAKPGEVQYGTAGVSTPMHLSTERYAMLNKIKLPTSDPAVAQAAAR